MSAYKEYKSLNLPEIEKEVLQFWKENSVFEKSVTNRNGSKPFVFYEGPPSANGMPGIHHVMGRAIKDLFCRYKTLQGYQVNRKSGWDTHGLPVEISVEKNLGITKEDIGKTITVENYNKECRREVLQYKDAWEDLTNKMGYWVDLEHPYVTYDNEYIETLWWALKTLYGKKLLYKGYTIQPYSPAAGTGLSTHELNQPGTYKLVKDTTIVAKFKLLEDEKSEFLTKESKVEYSDWFTGEDTYFLAWTTTPWTLPSNTALTVNKDVDYVLVRCRDAYNNKCNVILAKPLVKAYFNVDDESQLADGADVTNGSNPQKISRYKIIKSFKGSQLEGLRYQQLLPYQQPKDGDAFKVVVGDFVTTEDGTGIVHTAPSFGADDFRMAKKYGLGSLTLVDMRGRFVKGVGEFSGEYVKEDYLTDIEKEAERKRLGLEKYLSVDKRIAIKLKNEGLAFKIDNNFVHNYPHCWRTDKPVIYYPLDSWFIKSTSVKERLVELNKTINWKPESTGTGRFGNWLENLQDWNLSRSRFWGTPLPIWKNYNAKSIEEKYLCFGSFDELKERGYYISDDFINKIKGLKNKGRNEKRTREELIFETTLIRDGLRLNYLIDNIDKFENIGLIDVLISMSGFNGVHAVKYFTPIKNLTLKEVDLHRPYVDRVVIPSGENLFTREPDLIDVWFDSGAMPFAQWGLDHDKLAKNDPFPFKEGWDGAFPADFIAEGVDQTRGWFFTLHTLATMLFDSVAYKNVVSNGLVLDKVGNKMSKRLGNTVNPFETIEKNGADATRWYMVSNAQPWDNLKFDINGIDEVRRKFFGTLYNTYSFFSLYANIDKFNYKEKDIPLAQRPEIDRWIISLLNTLTKSVQQDMDDYEPTKAARNIQEFVDEHLSNWYVRLCRRRFWKGDYSEDKIAAYQTLYTCLETIAKLMSPVSPFFSDFLFRNLNEVTKREKVESVHLSNFPKADESVIDKSLEERMQLAQDISSLVLSLRKKVNIKVRQPLNKILVPVLSNDFKAQVEMVSNLILSEVNVKGIEFITETEGVIKKKTKANFKLLGQRLGKQMKAAADVIASFNQKQIAELEKNKTITVNVENGPVSVLLEEVEIISEDIPGWQVANKGELTVALDITITRELKEEGDARELVNKVQKYRKDSNFNVTDRIAVTIEKQAEIDSTIINHKDYICAEILADQLQLVDNLEEAETFEVNDFQVKIIIKQIK